jgi:hypothetical protein
MTDFKLEDFKIENINRNTILEMVKEEQKVRYSKTIQQAYTDQYYAQKNNPEYKVVRIEIDIQKFILRQFGFKYDTNSLNEYWKIPSMYWTDEEIKNSIFYMKLNMFQYPKISIDDDLIDTQLIGYSSNNKILLSSLQNQDRPLIILAGSMT